MRARFLTSVMATAGLAFSACAALAQDSSDLSASEIEKRFLSQQTRGLTIAPAAGTEANAPVAEPAPSGGYVQLSPEDQINIRIAFDFDSAALRESEKRKLDTLCDVLSRLDTGVFRIIGHTDASGSADYNERLSLLRAEEVKRHMVRDCGIDAGRLEALGMGEAYPANPDDPTGEQNRRVEFQAVS